MDKHPFLIATTTLLFIGAIAFIATQKKNQKENESTLNSNDKTNVLVSILPQKELVKNIGGEFVTVTELVHPGESPVTYSLTAQDLIAIEESDVYFRIGHIPFEKANVGKIESTNPDLLIVQISEETPLRYFGEDDAHGHEHDESEHEDEHGSDTIDPHLWLSIDNMIIHANSIAKTLSDIDPENAQSYEKNALAYTNELKGLKKEIAQSLSKLTNKNLLVFHPAWGYLADEHGLTQIAIEHDGNDPTAEQLSAIIDHAREDNINVIFVQSQFSTAAAENIAETLNIPVVQIDPLAESYIDNMKIISQKLYEKLQ